MTKDINYWLDSEPKKEKESVYPVDKENGFIVLFHRD